MGVSIDPAAGVSLPAEPVVDLTTISTSGGSSDSYTRTLSLPRHLSPHDHIRVSDGTGGSRTLEIIELIREARSNPASRQQLLTLATAAASDPSLLNQCYVSSEENLIPMLAQLGSADPVARREGALSLRQYILTHPEDRTLQQGLLATVADVARNDRDNVEARDLLVSVARDSSPQNAGLRNWMQHQSQIATLSGNSPAVADSSSSGSPIISAGAPLTRSLSADEASSPVGAAASFVSGAPIAAIPLAAFTANSADLIVAMIEHRTAGTPLEGVPTEGIVNFVQRHSGLPTGQFEDLLRLRILADALPLTGFTGNLFGTSTSVATLLAEDIRRGLSRGTDAAPDALLAGSAGPAPGNVSTDGAHPLVGAPVDGGVTVLAANAASVFPGTALNGGLANPIAFFVPALLTSLSGMQGLSSNPNNPTPLATLAMGLNGHSSYHVAGPDGIDGDSHEGFGGGSQGGSSGQEGGEHRDERREPSDAYLA